MTQMELAQRLEKLERDNRRFKHVTVTALAVIGALCVIYAAACSSGRKAAQPIPQKITAHEFDVVDGAGKVRVKVAMDCLPATNCWPGIKLFDENGKALTVLGAGTLTVSGEKQEASLLGDRLQFSTETKGSVPKITARLGNTSGGAGALSLTGIGGSYVLLNSDTPVVEMQDSDGFMMDLGSVDLTTVRTGKTNRTSAASIVMFGRDEKHHVIWRAP